MKLPLFIFFLLIVSTSFSQQSANQEKTAKVREELKQLWNLSQDAAVKKDRKTLESIYADEFLFVHAMGQEDNKQRMINNILGVNDYIKAPMPSFDDLYVYDNVAVLRVKGAIRGTTIYVKKNGQWQVVQIQSTNVPPERKTTIVDQKILQQYVGKYEQAPGVVTLITLEGDTLKAKGMNRPAVQILPLSETVFQVKDNIGVFTFYKDANGTVTHYILKVNDREIRGTKIE